MSWVHSTSVPASSASFKRLKDSHLSTPGKSLIAVATLCAWAASRITVVTWVFQLPRILNPSGVRNPFTPPAIVIRVGSALSAELADTGATCIPWSCILSASSGRASVSPVFLPVGRIDGRRCSEQLCISRLISGDGVSAASFNVIGTRIRGEYREKIPRRPTNSVRKILTSQRFVPLSIKGICAFVR